MSAEQHAHLFVLVLWLIALTLVLKKLTKYREHGHFIAPVLQTLTGLILLLCAADVALVAKAIPAVMTGLCGILWVSRGIEEYGDARFKWNITHDFQPQEEEPHWHAKEMPR